MPIQVEFIRFKKFIVVRCYGGRFNGDHLAADRLAARKLISKWNQSKK